MGETYTKRLGLTVDDDNDLIDQFARNWQLLDNAAGTIYVEPGVMPSNNVLYDGAMVVEKKTGKIWMAQKNALGGYDQVWVRYPYTFSGFSNYSAFSPGDSAYHEWGVVTYVPALSINASQADITQPQHRWRAPVNGTYLIHTGYYITGFAASVGGAQVVLGIGDGPAGEENTMVYAPVTPNGVASPRTTWQRYLSAGDTIKMSAAVFGRTTGLSIYAYQTVTSLSVITKGSPTGIP